MAVKAAVFSERLEAYRVLSGLSQASLAGMTGITINSLSRYERGENLPGIPHAVRIARALDVTVSDLIGDNLPAFNMEAAGLNREVPS